MKNSKGCKLSDEACRIFDGVCLFWLKMKSLLSMIGIVFIVFGWAFGMPYFLDKLEYGQHDYIYNVLCILTLTGIGLLAMLLVSKAITVCNMLDKQIKSLKRRN